MNSDATPKELLNSLTIHLLYTRNLAETYLDVVYN